MCLLQIVCLLEQGLQKILQVLTQLPVGERGGGGGGGWGGGGQNKGREGE